MQRLVEQYPGRVIGSITGDPSEVATVTGVGYAGMYDAVSNVTKDKNGNVIGQGNQLDYLVRKEYEAKFPN